MPLSMTTPQSSSSRSSDAQTPTHSTNVSGLLVVISGPSGVGKTTITRAVTDSVGAEFSVSATTRPITEADVEGRDYFFLSATAFEAKLANGEFLEHAQVFGNFYGTPRQPIVDARDAGKVVILEIDVQGAIQVRESLPDALMLFILPPSEAELLDRLRNRQRESEEVIARRFKEAQGEMELARSSGVYDQFIVNDDLDRAIADAATAIHNARQQARV